MTVILKEATAASFAIQTTPTSAKRRVLIRLIDVGEGSSGDYPAETLQLAATEKVFPAGTHMYIDHGAAIMRGPNGERSLRDLAAVLTEDARWVDESQSLEAEADVFGGFAETIAEIKDHIGTSIAASALVGPPRPGGSKPTIKRIVAVESVDFVVKAGRGGRILEIIESALHKTVEATSGDRREQLQTAIRDLYGSEETWIGVRDYDADALKVWFWLGDDDTFEQSYTVADDDLSVTLTGERTQVRAITQYVPVQSGGVITTETSKEEAMPEITQAELDRLNALDGQLKEAMQRAEKAEADLAEAAKAVEAAKVAEAKKQAAAKVIAATEGMAPAMSARIASVIEAQVTDPELPADLEARITSAVEAEKQYLATLTEGRLSGFGASFDTASTTIQPARTTNVWGQPISKEA